LLDPPEAPNVNGDDALVVLAGSDFPKLKTPAAAVGLAGSALKALPGFEPKVDFEAPDPNALVCCPPNAPVAPKTEG